MLAGGLYFVGNLRISPDAAFSVNWSAFGIFIVMIGGLGTLEGPIVGALIFFLLNQCLSDFGTWYLIGLGALAIVVTMFFPQGLRVSCRIATTCNYSPSAGASCFATPAPLNYACPTARPVRSTRARRHTVHEANHER